MTVLGSELKARYQKFFSVLDSRNIVVKNLKTKENDQALKSHLKGLGGVWDDMQGVDISKASENEVLPPFKRIRNDWRLKLQDWKDLKEDNPKKYNSKFLPEYHAQTDSQIYADLVKRNQLSEKTYKGKMSDMQKHLTKFLRKHVQPGQFNEEASKMFKTISSDKYLKSTSADHKRSLHEPNDRIWNEKQFLFGARESCPNMQTDDNFLKHLPNFKNSIVTKGMDFESTEKFSLA